MLIRPPTSFTLFPYTTLFRSSFDLIALRTRCTRDTRPVARLERRERLGEVSCPRPVCVRGVRRIEALVLDHVAVDAFAVADGRLERKRIRHQLEELLDACRREAGLRSDLLGRRVAVQLLGELPPGA